MSPQWTVKSPAWHFQAGEKASWKESHDAHHRTELTKVHEQIATWEQEYDAAIKNVIQDTHVIPAGEMWQQHQSKLRAKTWLQTALFDI